MDAVEQPLLRARREEPLAERASQDVLVFVDRALERLEGRARTRVVVVPAPAPPADAALAVLRAALATSCDPSTASGADVLMWDPPGGEVVVAAGVARRVQVRSEDRLADLRRGSDGVWARTDVEAHPTCAHVPRPRLFGGLSFVRGAADGEPWQGFGDGWLVLPRWTWGTSDSGAGWLALAVDGEELGRGVREGYRAQLARLLSALARASIGRDASRRLEPAPDARVDHLEARCWRNRVQQIREAIGRNGVSKVVAARRTLVERPDEIDPGRVLAALGEDYPGCTRFAFACGDRWFVGASPERLVTIRSRRLETEALAGTISRGRARALLGSLKDRREHGFVADTILERLGPLCTRLDRAGAPEVHELPNVLHLRTAFWGELCAGVHALDVVEALHPTPAVGGVPAAPALRWIVEHEEHARGWYSAPVGWIDSAGDAELVVSLRSGLIRGRTAWVWAGAGIVDGSDPEAEYAETALKMRPLLEALGVA